MASRMRNGKLACGKRTACGSPKVLGFAYVVLLVAIAAIAVAATSALRLGAQMARRDAEQALLSVGAEFDRALRSYSGVPVNAVSTNLAPLAGVLRGPRTLEELLKDNRTVGVKRHLRKIYSDPMTGLQKWGLVKDPAGFIVGVYSLAEGRPIKQSGFEARLAHFEEAQTYSSWVFGMPLLITRPSPPLTPPPNVPLPQSNTSR